MVHGCMAYMVEYGPRRNGATPAAYSRCSMAYRSSAVYHAFTGMRSAVFQTGEPSPGPAGSDFCGRSR